MATAKPPTALDRMQELTDEQKRILEFRDLLDDAKKALVSSPGAALAYDADEVEGAELRFQAMLASYPDIVDRIKARANVRVTRRDMTALLAGLRAIGQDKTNQDRLMLFWV